MILELLACVGLHWVLKYGTILNVPRNILKKIPLVNELLKCSLCLGFWCGVIVALYTKQNIVLFGFASCCVCWLFDNVNNVIQSAEIKLDKR